MTTAGVTPLAKWARSNARIQNEYLTESIAEFLGTMILCLFAVGSAFQSSIMNLDPNQSEPFATMVFATVFGLMISITVVGGSTGAHINPAVTFGLCIAGECNWYKLPFYWISQMLGGYSGAGLAYYLYKRRYEIQTGIPDLTKVPSLIGVFSPPPSITPFGVAFIDQIVTTSILLIAIMGVIDKRNMKVPKFFYGPIFALVVAGISMAFGINAGAVMNPARDLGPRLMAATIGFDPELIFKNAQGEHYWLIPLFGPMVGATLGITIYIFLVGSHLKDDEDEVKEYLPNGGLPPAGDWRSTVYIPKVLPTVPLSSSAPQSGGSGGYGTGNGNNNYPMSDSSNGVIHKLNYEAKSITPKKCDLLAVFSQ